MLQSLDTCDPSYGTILVFLELGVILTWRSPHGCVEKLKGDNWCLHNLCSFVGWHWIRGDLPIDQMYFESCMYKQWTMCFCSYVDCVLFSHVRVQRCAKYAEKMSVHTWILPEYIYWSVGNSWLCGYERLCKRRWRVKLTTLHEPIHNGLRYICVMRVVKWVPN